MEENVSALENDEIAAYGNFSDDFVTLRWNEEDDFIRHRKKNNVPKTKLLRSISLQNETPLSIKEEDRPLEGTEPRHNILPNLISELLKLSKENYKNTSDAKEIRRVEIAYKNNMENFLSKMDELMLSARRMRNKLIKSLRQFLVISRGTEYIILGSSVANLAVLIGSLMHKIFRFSWNSKMFLIPTVTGALSFTASLMAFTYMSQTTNDFSKDMRKEIRLLRDLIAVHQKGNWIDTMVSNLFPHGINLNLIDFENVNYYKKKPEWKEHLCSRIILSNIKKDKTLLKNENFLMKVKLFVENSAAEIWWSRMRIKKLLKEIEKRANETSAQQFLSNHEKLIYRTALCIFPVIIPWFTSSRSPDEMRFIFNTLGGFLSALELENDGSEELDNLKRMYMTYEKDFKEIYKICELLDGGED